MNPQHWRLLRKPIAAAMMFLLVSVHSPTAEADSWVRRDWNRVQRVIPGTKTTVLLYKDRAPGGIQEIEGKFKSATPGTLTLTLPSGNAHTLQKQDVRKVMVYRPFTSRYQGWITAGVAGGIMAGAAASEDDPSEPLPAAAGAALVALFVGLPTVIAFLVAPKMGGIYNVPPDRRDSTITGTKPPQKPSGKTVPEVKESEGNPASSREDDRFRGEKSGPELLRLQARRTLIRKGLPLRFPDRTVRGLSARRAGIGVQTAFDSSVLRADGSSRRASLD